MTMNTPEGYVSLRLLPRRLARAYPWSDASYDVHMTYLHVKRPIARARPGGGGIICRYRNIDHADLGRSTSGNCATPKIRGPYACGGRNRCQAVNSLEISEI